MAITKSGMLKWNKKKKKYKFAEIMVKKNVAQNYEDIALDYCVTYHQKDIIIISYGSIVVSINGKLTTIKNEIKQIYSMYFICYPF